MPSPAQSDLHVNQPLTNVSVAYLQQTSAYIADKVFPRVPVQKQSDMYWKMSKMDWKRTDVQRRAPGTESPGVGWNQFRDFYFAHVYAVHKDIDDQIRANADSVFSLDKQATEFITNQLLLKRDIDWNNTYFKSGVWGTNKTGTTDFTKWDDSTSDPIGDMAKWIIDFRQATGYKPNTMILGAHVMAALKQHPDIIDRIKYTQKGIVSEDLIATLFDVDKLMVSYATLTDQPRLSDPVADEAAATYKFIADTKGALILYTAPSPGLNTATAGYTFTWNGYMGGNSQGIRIKRFRMEHIASDRIEAEMTYDMKVVCPDLGIFLGSVVS